MKKKLTIALALTLIITALSANHLASAEDLSAKVLVSIANGTLVLAAEEITVTDVDNDGALTINDALYAAHEAKFDGGAAAGYGSASTEYGLSMTKLWGVENGGSYGYMVNNASAWSLADPVKTGDHVYAFVYTDTTAFSDSYSYFDKVTAEVGALDFLTLTLMGAGYDADWNPIQVPVAGAVITVNGEQTPYITDEAGTVTITLPTGAKDKVLVSAVSDSKLLVPPVCIVTVTASAQVPDETPKTYDGFMIPAAALLFIAAAAFMASAALKKENEM